MARTNNKNISVVINNTTKFDTGITLKAISLNQNTDFNDITTKANCNSSMSYSITSANSTLNTNDIIFAGLIEVKSNQNDCLEIQIFNQMYIEPILNNIHKTHSINTANSVESFIEIPLPSPYTDTLIQLNCTFIKLNLSNIDLDDECIDQISNLGITNVLALDMSANNLTDKAIHPLLVCAKEKSTISLDLSCNKEITDNSAEGIVKDLKSNKGIIFLNLQECSIGKENLNLINHQLENNQQFINVLLSYFKNNLIDIDKEQFEFKESDRADGSALKYWIDILIHVSIPTFAQYLQISSNINTEDLSILDIEQKTKEALVEIRPELSEMFYNASLGSLSFNSSDLTKDVSLQASDISVITSYLSIEEIFKMTMLNKSLYTEFKDIISTLDQANDSTNDDIFINTNAIAIEDIHVQGDISDIVTDVNHILTI